MQDFLASWHQAALTSAGLFWTAFWAFALGYLISGMIQVFVTRRRMRETMGTTGPRSVFLGSVFGFLSSSCSFAALATTRSLFTKGAGLIPSLAFLLASTNLVVELGIIIALFLGWQFVVGEYAGGILLILLMWLLVRLTYPRRLVDSARRHAREAEGSDDEAIPNWKELIRSAEGWSRVGHAYVMEWRMVWKDVSIGFTVAGAIAVFVPKEFFETLFVGSGGNQDLSLFEVLLQAIAGPLAAFFTFIGSMGNIPLAAVLHGNGVSFAGIMAFIFSDLVVFPVLRIQAAYYGWRMAAYILGVFLLVLVAAAIMMHYGFAALGLLPDAGAAGAVTQRSFFKVNYTLYFNVLFLVLSAAFLLWTWRSGSLHSGDATLGERILFLLALIALGWVGAGLALPLLSG